MTELYKPIKQRNTRKTYRNPIIQAREIALEIQLKQLTQGQMAKKLGCSRAQVTRKLNLLNLPRDLLLEIEAIGDYWERRLVTERGLRMKPEVRFHSGKSGLSILAWTVCPLTYPLFIGIYIGL